MRMVLENDKKVNILKLDLHAILEVSTKAMLSSGPHCADDLEKNMVIKCNLPLKLALLECSVYMWGWHGQH